MRLFFIIPCCAVQAVLGYDGPPPLTEVDGRSPIRMGGEMLGGYRSYYVHRGEKMGGDSLEAAISARPPCTEKSSIIWRTNARPVFLSTDSGMIPAL